MKTLAILLLTTALSLVWNCAQAAHQISVAPTPIMTSYFDYMISSYNDLPLQEIDPAQGGGRLAIYHASPVLGQIRKIFPAYINSGGMLLDIPNPWQNMNTRMGYPSLAIDSETGAAFYAWHMDSDEDDKLEVLMTYETTPGNAPGSYGLISVIFDPPNQPLGLGTEEYIWPSIKTGPSPVAGMRRVYILAKHYKGINDYYRNDVIVAYADFNLSNLSSQTPLTWQYTAIPTLQTWDSDLEVERCLYAAFTVGNDGMLYYMGNHWARENDTNFEVDEPDLDVFVCDNYGAGVWQHFEAESNIQLYNPYNNLSQSYAFVDQGGPLNDEEVSLHITYTGHFNIVLAAEGKLHMPGNWSLNLAGNNSDEYNSIKEVVFDTADNSFEIREIFPIAGTSSDELWWTPWDADGDMLCDNWPTLQPQPTMVSHFPFCHWDITENTDGMRFHYNYYRLTEPDSSGAMACLWQDSNKARLYHLDPANHPQYASYTDNPEIFLAITTNNGFTWREPEILSAVTEPELYGMTPMWVYPSSKLLSLGDSEQMHQKRLWLLFMDDNDWGSDSISPIVTYDWGDIVYMAVDLQSPVGNSDPQLPSVPQAVLQQNSPNPFQGTTLLKYSLKQSAEVSLNVFNLRGQLVRTLESRHQSAGDYSSLWDGRDNNGTAVASGVYLYRLELGKTSLTRRLLLLK